MTQRVMLTGFAYGSTYELPAGWEIVSSNALAYGVGLVIMDKEKIFTIRHRTINGERFCSEKCELLSQYDNGDECDLDMKKYNNSDIRIKPGGQCPGPGRYKLTRIDDGN